MNEADHINEMYIWKKLHYFIDSVACFITNNETLLQIHEVKNE